MLPFTSGKRLAIPGGVLSRRITPEARNREEEGHAHFRNNKTEWGGRLEEVAIREMRPG